MAILARLAFCTLLFCAVQVESKIEFIPPRHEIRLHYNAPPDLWVTTIRAIDKEHPNITIEYSLHEVQDHKYFRLNQTTGELCTKRHVFMRLGRILTIMVVAYNDEEATLKQIDVEIVEYNRYTPVFEYAIYRAEVVYTVSVNMSFLRVHATDADSMAYNAELYYTLRNSTYSNYFSMDLKTGELKLQKKLSSAITLVVLPVLVEDGGSPVRSANTTIEIYVKSISEPQKIRYQNPTGNTVEICWNRPTVGYVLGYLIRYREVGMVDNKFRDANVTSQNITYDGSSFCTQLRYLRPWTDYEFSVHAWNLNEVGLGSNLTIFGTRSNFCLSAPCKHGRCIPINGEPGYICDCDRGFYGPTCNLFNPCVLRPCGEFGICHNTSDRSYKCNCLEGFSGMNCSIFDPCAIRPSPCANGATCESDAPNTFRCLCQNGFYGRTCSLYDPCFSKPCLNGAECFNVSTIDFNCTCKPGFHGKRCEIDVDECISSPCWNGGTCIDRANGFTCQCQPGFTSDFCERINYCKEERTHLEHGLFHWPSARYQETIKVPCPVGPFDKQQNHSKPMAIRTCIYLGDRKLAWGPVDATRCKEEGFEVAEKVAGNLEMMTSHPANLSVYQLKEVTKQVENVVTYALYDRKIAKKMLTVISNMLDVNSSLLAVDRTTADSTERMVDVVKHFTSAVVIDKGQSISFETENLALKAVNWDPDVDNGTSDGLTFKASHEFGEETSLNETSKEKAYELVPTITIPKEALTIAANQNPNEIRVQFISFKNAKFFREKNSNKSEDTQQQVLIASISNVSVTNLSEPVMYSMQSLTNLPHLCAYWIEEEKTWGYDGITTNQSGDTVMCSSNHMTAFTILLDPDPHFELDAHHKMSLSIISYVGCALSIFGLTLTIITYSLFRCLNRDRSGKILLSLCVSMLLMNLAFIIGSQSNGSYDNILCVSVAVLIHYFLLTTLAWMCVEAINMYQMLVYVFASSETKFMLKRCLAAWGLPLLIVGITTGISIGYYKTSNEYCMLSPANPYVYYIAFLGPSCIILLVNSIVFIMVTRVLFQPRVTGKISADGRKRNQVTFAQVRGAFTVMTLLGVTWVFGALAVGPAKLAFQYIFCILNSLQGFLIFLVRCVQYPEARAAWVQLFQTGTLKKYRGGLVATSSHSHSNGSKGLNFHSQTSRSASADTNSSVYMNSSTKERKISVSSLMQMFRSGPRLSVASLDRKPSAVSSPAREAMKKRRASDGSHRKRKIPPPFEEPQLKVNIDKPPLHVGDSFSQRTPSLKEGRDTQWQYYCCSMKKPEDFQKELESQKITATPLLSVNPDDLPFIEDEPQEQTRKVESLSQCDQGYSSAENSPNSSRILSDSNLPSNPTATETDPNVIPNTQQCVDVLLETNKCADSENKENKDEEQATSPGDALIPRKSSDTGDTRLSNSLVNLCENLGECELEKRLKCKQSKSMGALNLKRVTESTTGLKCSKSVPALFIDDNKTPVVPSIICTNADDKNVESFLQANNETKNVPNNRNSAEVNPDDEFALGFVEDNVTLDFESDIESTDVNDSINRTEMSKGKHFLSSPKYNDALTVNSIENISYMDSSSLEGDNIL